MVWFFDSFKVVIILVDGCIYVYDVIKLVFVCMVIRNVYLGGVLVFVFVDFGILVSGGDDVCVCLWIVV